MGRRLEQGIREKAIQLVSSGITKAKTAEILGIGATTVSRIAKDYGKSFSYYSKELIAEILARIQNGEKPAALAREYGIDKACICLWQKKDKGIDRVFEAISEETKAKALELYGRGYNYMEIARELNVGNSPVRYWVRKAIDEGKIVLQKQPKKHGDLELKWVLKKFPKYSRWREFAVEWLSGESVNAYPKVRALVIFFEKYLAKFDLPSEPDALLIRGRVVPDLYEQACPQSPAGINYNNHLTDFLNWTLLNHYSIPADDGSPIVVSTFRNPFKRLSGKGFSSPQESVQTPLPYGYIADLRRVLAQGADFKDWVWAQNALGVKSEGQLANRNATDWYPVDEGVVDKDDPDCVYRYRQSVDPKVPPVLEMWSPVRWVGVLVKLQIPPRTFQVRMLDSGEADTWRYEQGKWVLNQNPLATGTKKKPTRQGVLRRGETHGAEEASLSLYFNTNKTADVAKDATHKGYEFPWPVMGDVQDQPQYWLEKLRNWQEKYNPLQRRTTWSELPTRCFSDMKTKHQLASYPDACFLFRAAELAKEGEAHVPLSNGAVCMAWGKLLEEFANQLAKKNVTHADGSAIQLVAFDGRSPIPLFPLHSLRVSLITSLALDGGLPFHILTKLAGHSRLVMTLYYTKVGFKHMQDALIGAAEKMDQAKASSIISFLSNAEYKRLLNDAIWNNADTYKCIPEYPANRNPASWLPLHIGVCIVGGNTSEIESNVQLGGLKLGGCHNGGPVINETAKFRSYRAVPGGPRNCVRCRWFVTEPHYIPALTAHLSNVCYHFDAARDEAVKLDGKLNDLKRKRIDAESTDTVFYDQGALLATERQWEAAMQRFNDLAEDMVACWLLIQRCDALTKRDANSGRAMVAVGDATDIHVAFEEVNSELLQLSGVCENVEVYPDLRPGKAILRRSQLLDAALIREKSEPFFLILSEEEQLRVGNAFMRHLSKMAHPNPLIGIRKVCNLVDSGASLSEFLGLDATQLLGSLESDSAKPITLGLRR